jgi:hypothetical protein|uniref:Uncharacterized protein n=1 Tax=viral metagenome TaxID=1070528 RepID=A0A6C0B129_9ZZZZ
MEGARRTRHKRRTMRGGIGYGEDEFDLLKGKFAEQTAVERNRELARMRQARADRGATHTAAVTLSNKLSPAPSTRTSRASSTASAGRRRTRRRKSRRRR